MGEWGRGDNGGRQGHMEGVGRERAGRGEGKGGASKERRERQGRAGNGKLMQKVARTSPVKTDLATGKEEGKLEDSSGWIAECSSTNSEKRRCSIKVERMLGRREGRGKGGS